MNSRMKELTESIRGLEAELAAEIQRIRIRTYEIRDRTIRFSAETRRSHRAQATRLLTYLRQARLKHVLTAPVIWCCLFPALLMDGVVTLYQWICFPVYGIPKVRRREHMVIDHHHLAYLNLIEKANCMFCSYFNGLVSYIGEVAARTEQYWCPIKHATPLKRAHSRYAGFAEYGDAETFKADEDTLRTNFGDLRDEQRDTK